MNEYQRQESVEASAAIKRQNDLSIAEEQEKEARYDHATLGEPTDLEIVDYRRELGNIILGEE